MMRVKSAFPALMVAVLLPSAAPAQQPSTVIEYRQDLMSALASHSGLLRMVREGVVDDPAHLVAHATAIQGLADMMVDVFPEGTGEGETRALPAIWERASEFEAIVQEIRTAAADLVSAARSGDGAGVDEARAALGQTCQTCHRAFRAPPPPR